MSVHIFRVPYDEYQFEFEGVEYRLTLPYHYAYEPDLKKKGKISKWVNCRVTKKLWEFAKNQVDWDEHLKNCGEYQDKYC